jgi:hypothetical protein
MQDRIKNNIKIEYNYDGSGNVQEKLDDIFDFIFDKVIEKMRFDNLQQFNYTYNSLESKGENNGKQRTRVSNSCPSVRKTTSSLANRS